jgi:hypothetical protein
MPRWSARPVRRSLGAVSIHPNNEPSPNASPVPLRERRGNENDRRSLTLRTLLTSGLAPRRRAGRRAGEHESPVDFHDPYLLTLAIAMLVLSVADGFLTVTLMSDGAEEANPVLAFVLAEQPRLFAAVKMGMTGFGVMLLVAMARARLFELVRASVFLRGLVVAYFALVAYEAWLVSSMV